MPNPKKTTLHIDCPLGGTVKKSGFQKQGPFTTIQSTNIWPIDATDNREVSATRPPLEPFESVTDNINLLVRVTGDGNSDPQNTFLYAADGSLYVWNGSGFDQVDEAFSPSTVPDITTGRPVYATAFLENVVIANSGTPLVYNHTDQIATNKLTYLTATVGEVPQDCRIVATWQGAVWFAGAPDSPHILYASRTGDITDYNYSALPEDEGGAFATIEDNEGLIGEPITALMPQTTDTMVVGCIDSMWAIKGHPRRGGSVESISTKIGPLGQGAWAKAPDNTLFVLTKVGLVTIAPQDGAIPSLISKEKIPNDIIGLDFDTLNPVVSMSYDTVWNGLIINVRGAQEQSWWFDPKYGGFHRMRFDDNDYPTVMLNFPELDSATASGALFGCSDGLFRFDINGTTEVPDYDLMIGPVKISPNATLKSKAETLKVVFGLHSIMDGDLSLWVGADGEEVYNNAINDRAGTGFTIDLMTLATNNGYCRPQLTNHAIILELEGSDRIIFESADLKFIEAGTMRAKRNWSVEPRVSAGPDQITEFLDFPTSWTGYAEATPDNPASTLTDFLFCVDLAYMPAEWWDMTSEDGSSIVVSDSSDVRVPMDLVNFNFGDMAGLIFFKSTKTTSNKTFRIWTRPSSRTPIPPDHEFGQYNTYNSFIRGFWPDGGGNDRTSFLNHLTMTGSPTTTTGPIPSSLAYIYNGTSQYGIGTVSVPTNTAYTMFSWGNTTSDTLQQTVIGLSNNTISHESILDFAGASTIPINDPVRVIRDNAGGAFTSTGFTTGTWYHATGNFGTATSRIAYINGVAGPTNTNSFPITGVYNRIMVAHRGGLIQKFHGELSLLSLHTTTRNAAWIAYDFAMNNDQPAFWNTWVFHQP